MTAPTTGLELLRLALTEMEASDPRALQVETGASQAIGCRAESLFRLLGVPESDSRLRLDALIGKAAHAYAEEALKKVADRFELLVEHRASYRGVPCTIDLGWVGAAKLIDWKFPRKSKISWMQKNGIGNGYRGQIHLGGAALRAEGYDIQTVGLACLARDGEFEEAVEFIEPFDQQIADAAADRVAEERARATEMEGILDRLAVDEAGKVPEVRHAIDMWQLRDEDLFFCRSFCSHVTNCRGDEPDPATPTDEDLAVAQEYLAAWQQKREAESILDELKPRFAGRPRIPVGDREIGWVGGNTRSETVADVDAALEAYQLLVGPLPTRTEQVVDVAAALEAYQLLAGPLPVKTVTSTTTRSLKVFPASKKRKTAPDA